MDNSSIFLTIGLETYLVFIALQCLAAPLAIFLSPPQKVDSSIRDKHGVLFLTRLLNRSNEVMEAKSR